MRATRTLNSGRIAATLGVCFVSLALSVSLSAGDLSDRKRGLLLGSLFGDAAGGPIEFAPTDWDSDPLVNTPLTSESKKRLAARLQLRDYPMEAAPYAQWIDFAPKGTITDDSRHKLVLLESGRRPGGFTRRNYIETAIDYYSDASADDYDWRQQWLAEYALHFHWLAQTEFQKNVPTEPAYPTARLWGGIPTMAGQMPLLQIACLFPGDPDAAYRKAWELNILDTGYAKDVTSALVAGLARCLVNPGDNWQKVIASMRDTDPYGFAEVPWVERRFTRWLNRAIALGQDSRDSKSPASFFRALEGALEAETWWEARVPYVITFAILEYTNYNPLASMELALNFGRDTDSTAQLMGAFLGAQLGAGFLDSSLADPVEMQLQSQYGETIDSWLETLNASTRQ